MLLSVRNLRIAFRMEGKVSVPVRGVSFDVPENGRVALVGESGCGKSLTALAVGGLVDRAEGQATFVSDSLCPRMLHISSAMCGANGCKSLTNVSHGSR